MSANLCGCCHVTALAASIAKFDGRSCQHYYTLLLDENLASLHARYPSDTWTPERTACMFCERTEFPPIELYWAAQCYQYQACEHDAWMDSRARALTDQLKQRCVDALRFTPKHLDEREATWGIRSRHDEHSPTLRTLALEQSEAMRRMFEALTSYTKAGEQELELLNLKAQEFGREPVVQDSEYPLTIARLLAAMLDLSVPNTPFDWHDGHGVARAIAERTGAKL